MILECNVWCTDSDENKNLGLPDGDIWMPIAINLHAVVAIKEAGGNDFVGEHKATIYLPNEHFVIDLDYKEAVKLWKHKKI